MTRDPPPPVRRPRRGSDGGAPGGPAPQQTATDGQYVPDEVLFTARSETTPQEIDQLARDFSLTPITSETIALLGITLHRYRIPDRRSVPAVVEALTADSRIGEAQPNYRFSLQEERDAAAMAEAQYVPEMLHLDEAHRLSKGGGVRVAVIDSGVSAGHPELRGAVEERFNALDSPFVVDDHGTSIAGAIAARGLLKGIAPEARVLAARAFAATNGQPEGSTFHILRALSWAWENKARVINLSFAGPDDPLLARGLAEASRQGLVPVAAVGNTGRTSPPLFPAADPNVIAVTATDGAGRLYARAVRGRHVLVSAPGVDVFVPVGDDAYQFATGTSIAAAHVSGLVALMLDRDPTLDLEAVREILIKVARDLGPPGRDPGYGVGLPDAYETLQAVEPRVAGPGLRE